jgi:hypothetical protein
LDSTLLWKREDYRRRSGNTSSLCQRPNPNSIAFIALAHESRESGRLTILDIEIRLILKFDVIDYSSLQEVNLRAIEKLCVHATNRCEKTDETLGSADGIQELPIAGMVFLDLRIDDDKTTTDCVPDISFQDCFLKSNE